MSTVTNSSLSDRDVRQRTLVPPERLAACQALVIGVGAVGRQVAWQLAALGVRRLVLVDPDDVRVENLAPQGYLPEDLGNLKVQATETFCKRMHPQIQIEARAERFKRSIIQELCPNLETAVFTCVDSIVTRRWVWEAVHRHAAFFVDGRMNGEVIRVLASALPAQDRLYARTLFPAEEAFAGSCHASSTIYTASIAAGLMVSQFTKWLRRHPVDADVMLNLLAAEFIAR